MSIDLRDLSNYGGFIIGILGIILSLYLYRKSLEAKEPRFYYKTYRDIEKLTVGKSSDIQVLYKDQDVDRVFSTYVWFWNGGKKPINKQDIPQQSKIIFRCIDKEFPAKVLDYRILRTSRDAINFVIGEKGDDFISIGFDFLDQNDGAVLEIQHTGSYETEVQSEGIILGVPDGVRVKGQRTLRKYVQRLISSKPVKSKKDVIVSPLRSTFSKVLRIIGVVISIVLFLGMIGGFFYIMNFDTTVRVSETKLHDALAKNLPNVTDDSVQSIITDLSTKSDARSALTVFMNIFMIFYFFILIPSLFWDRFIPPYPKSLFIPDLRDKSE